jgi:predicted lipoprotein with Yx(FWY)xxD motif
MLKVEKTKIGKVVADKRTHTLYMFRGDHGTTSTCDGKCATFWPPLTTVGKPLAGPGVKASLLGTTKRKDGKLQVTYKGPPRCTRSWRPRSPLRRRVRARRPSEPAGMR